MGADRSSAHMLYMTCSPESRYASDELPVITSTLSTPVSVVPVASKILREIDPRLMAPKLVRLVLLVPDEFIALPDP